jgi:hypothetical protein
MGDKLTIWGKSGGGGGHELIVRKITVRINANQNDQTNPKIIQVKDFGASSDDCHEEGEEECEEDMME